MIQYGVQLPTPSASKVVYQIIGDSCTNFPQAFKNYQQASNAKQFAQKYKDYMSQFEIFRVLSDNRTEIASFVLDNIYQKFLFVDEGDTSTNLQEYMKQQKQSLPLKTLTYPWCQDKKQEFSLSYDGKIYSEKKELQELSQFLYQKNVCSKAASDAIYWLTEFFFSGNKNILSGKKFVLLGGTAELSPIFYLLQRGASVLTTHVKNIDRVIEQAGEFSGKLHYCPEGMNLLTQPSEIATTIREFANEDSVHIGILAYQGGKGRELRLTAAIDAILREIKNVAKSIAFYLSPSVITEVSKDIAEKSINANNKPLNAGKKVLKTFSGQKWYIPAIIQKNERYWAQTICDFQGCSYAAFNIFGKYYPAEVYQKDVTISANLGGITTTSSMKTPFLQAAFRQAKKLNIEIFEAPETRDFLQALWLHDILNANAHAKNIFEKQVHGGVFTLPWVLNGIVEEAAVYGNIKRFLFIDKNAYTKQCSQKLLQGISQQVVYVDSAIQLESILGSLKGDFAKAFVGGKKVKPVTHLFLGDARMIPIKFAKMLPILAKAHKTPFLGKQLYKWSQGKKIHGHLLTNMIWMQYKKGDRISLSTNKNGELETIRIYKISGQDLEFSWAKKNTIRQTMYFGRALQDKSESLSLEYSYDPKTGNMATLGPTAIESSSLEKSISLKTFAITNNILSEFEHLLRQSAQGSISFPVNSGILLDAMDILKSPNWKVDFSRVTVFSLELYAIENIIFTGSEKVNTRITPTDLKQTDKGQLFTTTLEMCMQEKLFHKAKISLLVRGNMTDAKSEKIPRIHYREEYDEKIQIRTMNDSNLVDFATLNGDYNPLHQIDSTANVVGFKRRINPGLGILAEIETALRKQFTKTIIKLTATIVRPAYPDHEYILQWKKRDNDWSYQMVQEKSNKVLVDGVFSLGHNFQK